jgi:transposase
MGRITNKQLSLKLKELEKILKPKYKLIYEEKERDWRTYEQQYMERVRTALKNLDPLLTKATLSIQRCNKKGDKPKLTSKQKLQVLLVKHIVEKSNRMMANMMCLFSMLTNIDISYKTVERLYSDDEIEMGLHNLHVLLLKKRGVNHIDACGDATGYTLTVRKHYASYVQKRKDKAKKQKGKKVFVYAFMLMDLRTKMYVCYGTSYKSEKEAFEQGMQMLNRIDVIIDSVRLDKYYSFPSYVDRFSNSKVYIIPRKNATLRGSQKWKKVIRAFIEDTLTYLHEYYKRNHSESGFGADKKRFGWKVGQKRPDRVDTAMFSTTVWHNLLCLV